MRALILAAGAGKRLGPVAGERIPKCLLRFGDETLLARHVRLLRALGIRDIAVVTGFRHELVHSEIAEIVQGHELSVVHNPDFYQGSILSVQVARQHLVGTHEVLLMDADVLYDFRILARLVEAPRTDRLLIDRVFPDSDEPVRLYSAAGRPVEFRKLPRTVPPHDCVGESVGFFRLSPRSASELWDRAEAYRVAGRVEEPHEEAIRDMLLADPGRFGHEDITGWPWTEIDFPEDLVHANERVFPALSSTEPAEQEPGNQAGADRNDG